MEQKRGVQILAVLLVQEVDQSRRHPLAHGRSTVPERWRPATLRQLRQDDESRKKDLPDS